MKKIIIAAIGIIIFSIIYIMLKKILLKIIKKGKKFDKRKETYFKLIKNIMKYIFILIIIAFILSLYGINVTSIIAGLGIVSVIAGLALQDALKDIIMGLNIIIDGYYSVGDVVRINDFEGKVLEIGLKATKIKDLATSDILIIANRNVSGSINISNEIDIDIPLRYEDNIDIIENILNEIVNEIKNIDNVEMCEYKGIKEFGESAIYYKIKIYANPEIKKKIKMNANKIIKKILDDNSIEIPYNQIEIHNK